MGTQSTWGPSSVWGHHRLVQPASLSIRFSLPLHFKKMKILIAVQVLLHLVLTTKACTEFRMTAKDGTVVVGRSMEFMLDLMSNMIVEPKGHAHTAVLPKHCAQHQPLRWANKHTIAYVDALGLNDIGVDGLNEAGLSVGALLFPGFAKYQDIPEARCGLSISNLELPLWLLGNFATVQEVREALAKDTFPLVWERKLKLRDINPEYTFELHYSVIDKHGDGIVLELTKEGRKMHKNTIGVMTNSPPYDWHMTNIRNHIQLSKFGRDPLILGQEKFQATGEGSGLLGMPGDLTPPTRLVRTAAMVHFADPVQTKEEAVNLGLHILNTVDIPKGVIMSREHKNLADFTSWIVVKDLKNKAIYFRVYEDLTIRVIHLDKVTTPKKMQLKMGRTIGGFVDVTNELKPSDTLRSDL